MEEMKNPNQHMTGQTVRVLIAMVIIFFGFLYVQHTSRQKIGVEAGIRTLSPTVPENGREGNTNALDHTAKTVPQTSAKAEKLDVLAKPFFRRAQLDSSASCSELGMGYFAAHFGD